MASKNNPANRGNKKVDNSAWKSFQGKNKYELVMQKGDYFFGFTDAEDYTVVAKSLGLNPEKVREYQIDPR